MQGNNSFLDTVMRTVQAALPIQTPTCIAQATILNQNSDAEMCVVASADPAGWLLQVLSELCVVAHAKMTPQQFAKWNDEHAVLGDCKVPTHLCGMYVHDRMQFINALMDVAPSPYGVVVHLVYNHGFATSMPLADFVADPTLLVGTVPTMCSVDGFPPEHILNTLILQYQSLVYVAGPETTHPHHIESAIQVLRWRQRQIQVTLAREQYIGGAVLDTIDFIPSPNTPQCRWGSTCRACKRFGCHHPRFHPVPVPPDVRDTKSVGLSVRDWNLMMIWHKRSLIEWQDERCRVCRGDDVVTDKRNGALPYQRPQRKRRTKSAKVGTTRSRLERHKLHWAAQEDQSD